MQDYSKPRTRVLLWTVARSLSSAFERSIRELSTVKVCYQPHRGAYYYGPERKTNGVLSSEIKRKYAHHTYDYADSILLDTYDGFDAVFAKCMAYFFSNHQLPCYLEGKFSEFKHTFLIRNPHLARPSLWKALKRSGLEDRWCEEADDISKLYDFFKLVQSKSKDVIVVDAADLLSNPENMMEQYCKRSGLPYDKNMVTWTPEIVQDWTEAEFWKEFHETAMKSSGFKKQDSSSTDADSYPQEVERGIQNDMPYYEAMYKHRIQLP